MIIEFGDSKDCLHFCSNYSFISTFNNQQMKKTALVLTIGFAYKF